MPEEFEDDFEFDYAAEEDWDDYDHCYECTGYGDDYFINEHGDLESSCPTCPYNQFGRDTYDDNDDNYWTDDDWDE